MDDSRAKEIRADAARRALGHFGATPAAAPQRIQPAPPAAPGVAAANVARASGIEGADVIAQAVVVALQGLTRSMASKAELRAELQGFENRIEQIIAMLPGDGEWLRRDGNGLQWDTIDESGRAKPSGYDVWKGVRRPIEVENTDGYQWYRVHLRDGTQEYVEGDGSPTGGFTDTEEWEYFYLPTLYGDARVPLD